MIRLYVTGDLSPGAAVAPTLDQSRYLTQVMRLKAGDELLVFNGRDGEWRALIAEVLKKGVILRAEAQTRPQTLGPDLELIVAVVKKARVETIVEKPLDHGRSLRWVVGPVTVGHDIDIGIDVGEHAPEHSTLPGKRFENDNSSLVECLNCGVVG